MIYSHVLVTDNHSQAIDNLALVAMLHLLIVIYQLDSSESATLQTALSVRLSVGPEDLN